MVGICLDHGAYPGHWRNVRLITKCPMGTTYPDADRHRRPTIEKHTIAPVFQVHKSVFEHIIEVDPQFGWIVRVEEDGVLQLHVSNIPFPVGFGVRLVHRLRDKVVCPTDLFPFKDVGQRRLYHHVLAPT